MSNFKKIILISLLAAFLVLLLASFSLAEEEEGKPLEIEYPEIGKWRPVTVEQAFLPEYIKYIFNFAVAIAGLVVFGALIYGGFRYITSVGAPTAQTEAKDQIFAGVIGLVILLSSYLILTTINPQLTLLKSPTILKITATNIPGVYLSTEATFPSDEEIKTGKKKVYPLISSTDDLRNLVDGDIKSLKIVNQQIVEVEGKEVIIEPDFYYGVVLYKEKNQEGFCSYARSLDSPKKTISLTNNPASITVFQEVKKGYGKVTLCSAPDGGGECQSWVWDGGTNIHKKLSDYGLDRNVWSIKIEGNFLVVLQGETPRKWSWGGTTGEIQCKSFTSSASDLKGYLMNSCNPHTNATFLFGWAWYDSCATYVDIYPIL